MSTFSVMIYNQTRNLDGYGENVRTPFIYTYKGKMKKKLRSRCSRQDEISSASASCLLSSSIWFSWTHPTESSVSTCHIICLNSVSQETIEAYQVPTLYWFLVILQAMRKLGMKFVFLEITAKTRYESCRILTHLSSFY